MSSVKKIQSFQQRKWFVLTRNKAQSRYITSSSDLRVTRDKESQKHSYVRRRNSSQTIRKKVFGLYKHFLKIFKLSPFSSIYEFFRRQRLRLKSLKDSKLILWRSLYIGHVISKSNTDRNDMVKTSRNQGTKKANGRRQPASLARWKNSSINIWQNMDPESRGERSRQSVRIKAEQMAYL